MVNQKKLKALVTHAKFLNKAATMGAFDILYYLQLKKVFTLPTPEFNTNLGLGLAKLLNTPTCSMNYVKFVFRNFPNIVCTEVDPISGKNALYFLTKHVQTLLEGPDGKVKYAELVQWMPEIVLEKILNEKKKFKYRRELLPFGVLILLNNPLSLEYVLPHLHSTEEEKQRYIAWVIVQYIVDKEYRQAFLLLKRYPDAKLSDPNPFLNKNFADIIAQMMQEALDEPSHHEMSELQYYFPLQFKQNLKLKYKGDQTFLEMVIERLSSINDPDAEVELEAILNLFLKKIQDPDFTFMVKLAMAGEYKKIDDILNLSDRFQIKNMKLMEDVLFQKFVQAIISNDRTQLLQFRMHLPYVFNNFLAKRNPNGLSITDILRCVSEPPELKPFSATLFSKKNPEKNLTWALLQFNQFELSKSCKWMLPAEGDAINYREMYTWLVKPAGQKKTLGII